MQNEKQEIRKEAKKKKALASSGRDHPNPIDSMDNTSNRILDPELPLVTITRSKYNWLWYRKFKGEVFAVTDDHPRYYKVLVGEKELNVLKTDCEPYYDQD